MNNLDKRASEEFLDTYEGEVQFVCDDLEVYIARLDNGDIDAHLLESIADTNEEIANIFLSSTYTRHLSLIFLENTQFLRKLEFETLNLDNEGFFFLARITEDIHMYIEKYFVNREFSDVYIFQESLMNSIEMMERAFVGEEEKMISELEFFDD